MPTRSTRRLWFLARLVFAATWTLFAAEVYLRLFHPVPRLPRYVCATEFGIRGNMANRSYWHRTPDYEINIRTNSRGIRADEEIPYEKPKGVKRIIALGDSFGMGYEVDLKDTFLSRMSDQLKLAGVNAQVVNLSVSGHGNAEELIMLRNEGIKYHPDLVLLAWHRSDLANNVTCGLFALEDGDLVRRGKTFLPGVRANEILSSFAAYRWAADNSHLYSWVREWASDQVYKTLAVLRSVRHQAAPDGQSLASAGVGRQGSHASEEALTLALLHAIAEEAAGCGVKLLILDVPNHRSREDFYSSFPPVSDDPGQALDVVSPISVFQQHKGDLLYWERSQGHFTPLGCELVGGVLAEHILARQLLRN